MKERGLKKVILIILLIASTIFAETIYETHTYTMGDNDSKSEARQICFLEAKRKLIEKVGVYIESNTTVKDYQLTNNVITSFSAALMKVETVNENWSQVNGTFQVDLKIKAEIDKDFHSNLLKLLEDKESRNKIANQQDKLKELEDKLEQLNKKISRSNYDNSTSLRKERNIIFEDISKADQIMLKIKNITKQAVENIRIGMSKNEMLEVSGRYRSTTSFYVGNYGDITCFNYGKIWVVLSNDFVIGYIPFNYFNNRMGFHQMKRILYDFKGEKIYN